VWRPDERPGGGGTRALGSRRPGTVTHPPASRALAVIGRARSMTGHKWASSERAGAARGKNRLPR